jgi:hypothetical protein
MVISADQVNPRGGDMLNCLHIEAGGLELALPVSRKFGLLHTTFHKSLSTIVDSALTKSEPSGSLGVIIVIEFPGNELIYLMVIGSI